MNRRNCWNDNCGTVKGSGVCGWLKFTFFSKCALMDGAKRNFFSVRYSQILNSNDVLEILLKIRDWMKWKYIHSLNQTIYLRPNFVEKDFSKWWVGMRFYRIANYLFHSIEQLILYYQLNWFTRKRLFSKFKTDQNHFHSIFWNCNPSKSKNKRMKGLFLSLFSLSLSSSWLKENNSCQL